MDSNPLKISELTQKIQKLVNGAFGGGSYWVLGEITNHSYQQNRGYHYFDMVEKEEAGISLKARVNAVAWLEGALKIQEFENITGQKFQNDIRILAQVSVDYHSVFGLKLTLLDLDVHYTLGALEQQRQKTLIRLLTECSDFIRKEGDRFITRNNQIPLARVIQTLAVISSKNSAGFQDFEHTLLHNSQGYRFHVDTYFTQVQGESNAERIQDTLLDIFRSKISYDAVFLVRGGGASTDFLIFDTYLLAKIVAKFPIPIITGIGHQKNETLVDMMAHTPTKTPTQAAEFLIHHNREFELSLMRLRQGIAIRSQKFLAFQQKEWNETRTHLVNHSRDWIDYLNLSLNHVNQGIIQGSRSRIFENQRNLWNEGNRIVQLPVRLLIRQNLSLENHWLRTQTGFKTLIYQKNQNLEHWASLFRVLSPDQILKRGYALVKNRGKIIRDLSHVEKGDLVEIVLYDEEIFVTVNEKRIRKRNESEL